MTPTRRLAGVLAATRELPAAIRSHAGLVVADTLAAMAAGSGEAEVERLLGRANPPGPCTVVGRQEGTTAERAAFLNATAGTAAELDEGNYAAGGHPAIHTLPAALADAEQRNASGADLIDALVMGYEAAARVGAATLLRDNVHSHGTWGVIGAAVAVGRLRGYDADRFAAVIACAASLANASSRRSGLRGATVRSAFAGVAVQNGLLACDLVEAGFSGEADALETVFGTILGQRFEPAIMLDGLGLSWMIGQNFFKAVASCRETHGALDAWDDLLARHPDVVIDGAAVEAIRVDTFEAASLLTEQAPATALAARYSIPFTLATRIVRGDTGPSGFRGDALADKRVADLAARIAVVHDAAKTAALPLRRLTDITILLRDGGRLRGSTDGSPGDPGKPFSLADHRLKFAMSGHALWGSASPAILEACLHLDRLACVRDLTGLLRAATSSAAS